MSPSLGSLTPVLTPGRRGMFISSSRYDPCRPITFIPRLTGKCRVSVSLRRFTPFRSVF